MVNRRPVFLSWPVNIATRATQSLDFYQEFRRVHQHRQEQSASGDCHDPLGQSIRQFKANLAVYCRIRPINDPGLDISSFAVVIFDPRWRVLATGSAISDCRTSQTYESLGFYRRVTLVPGLFRHSTNPAPQEVARTSISSSPEPRKSILPTPQVLQPVFRQPASARRDMSASY